MDRRRDEIAEASTAPIVQGCLVGLAAAALLVGIVSATVLRHIVQIIPIALALGVIRKRPAIGGYAALPIFAFWTFAVVMIWLFLLGLAGLASGRYSPTEVAATVVMAGCSLFGGMNAIQLGRSLRPMRKILVFVLFLVLQLLVMWVSFMRTIAYD